MTNSRLSLFLLMPTKQHVSRETKLYLKYFFKIATTRKLIYILPDKVTTPEEVAQKEVTMVLVKGVVLVQEVVLNQED